MTDSDFVVDVDVMCVERFVMSPEEREWEVVVAFWEDIWYQLVRCVCECEEEKGERTVVVVWWWC